MTVFTGKLMKAITKSNKLSLICILSRDFPENEFPNVLMRMHDL